MGLLVIYREVVEDVTDEGVYNYSRYYYCRVIRFSGSGDIIRFQEKELMSIKEYDQEQLKEESVRNSMREDIKILQNEIFQEFGVTKASNIVLKDQPDLRYMVTGFIVNQETNQYELSLRQLSTGLNSDRITRNVKSPSEIESIS